jgi:hypothetical protein
VKLSRYAALGFIATLVACNPTLPPPPPGWNLELRAGTTNIDSSFFQSTKPDATRSSVDATRFEQLREAIIKKVPNLNLGSTLASGFVLNPKATKSGTRETAAFSLSLFMAVSKDGASPASDLSFIYSGPKGTNDKPVVYPAGKAWIASVFTAPKGNGSYTFSSTLQDGTLAGTVSVNLEDQTQWLPFALAASNPNVFGASMGQYANVFIAKWQAVPEAQSYIGLVLDRTTDKYVGSFLTKDTQVETQEFNGVQDHTYSLDLIATNIDLTKDDTKSYGTLPTSMKTSLSRFYLNSFGGTPGLTLDQTRVNLLVKPNQTSEAILKIKNLGTSPLGYTASISGTGLELGAGANSILLNEETRELHVKGTCTGADLTGTITITSNDPNNKIKPVPVTLECDVPVTATLELKKLTHDFDVKFVQYSPDGKKVATSDGGDVIIWDALTGQAIRRIKSGLGQYNVFSLAWHPGSQNLGVVGSSDVQIFDVNTGLKVVTVRPNGTFQSIDWNADGSQFAVGLRGSIEIYSSLGALVRQIVVANSDPSWSEIVSWSKSSGKLASASGNRISVLDPTTGIELNRFSGIATSRAASWNPTGDTVAFHSSDTRSIGVWNINNPNLERLIPIQPSNDNFSTQSNVQWNPKDSTIAFIVNDFSVTGSPKTLMRTWDASTGNFLKELLISTPGFPIQSMEFDWNPEGQSFLTQDNHFAVSWNAATGAREVQFGSLPGAIPSIHFNSDGTQLLVAANPDTLKGSLNLVDIPSGVITKKIATSQPISFVDWRKDTEQVVAVLGNSGIVQAYTPGSWNLLNAYEGYSPSVYSPDGTKIAVGLNDHQVRILNASTGAVLQTITIPASTCVACPGVSPLQGIVWNPDNSKVAILSSSHKLDVHDVTSGNLVWEKTVSVSGFDNDLTWSPDGNILAIGGVVLNASTGDSVQVFDQNPNDSMVPKVLAWSPDSRYVLTKREKLIELRNAHSGRVVLSILEIPEPSYWFQYPKVVANWNAQSNRFVFTDAGSGIYVYKFSRP